MTNPGKLRLFPQLLVTTGGFAFQWGLRNAPLIFQRMVNTLFSGVIGKGLFVYLDDLIVVFKDLDSHLQQLSLVFRKLTQAGLKAKLINVSSANHASNSFDTLSMEMAFTQLIQKSLLCRSSIPPQLWRKSARS